jgi:tetratricopeptide repeat protein 21B
MKKRSRYMTVISFNQNVRSQIFVEYAKALAADKQNKKAKEIMEQAIMEFAGTEDEPVVLLGNADIAIIGGDLKKALNILRSVEPMAKGYLEARGKLADIYLNKMLNRRQYAKCYFDLVQVFPNFENYKKYGDALLQIQEPDKAIEAYQEALRIDPSNQFIVRAIGKALSITHNYQRAIEYYEEAVQSHPNNDDLKLDHAKLLVKNNFIDVRSVNGRKQRKCWTGTRCCRWRKRSRSRV